MSDQIRQLLVPDALWPHITGWLESRGLTVGDITEQVGDDSLPTFVIGVSEALMKDMDQCPACGTLGSCNGPICALLDVKELLDRTARHPHGARPSYRCFIERHDDCHKVIDAGCTCGCHGGTT